MSVAKGIPSVVNVINSLVGVSSFSVVTPKACLIAQIFKMIFLRLYTLIPSAHAYVVNLRMQASHVAPDVVWTL